MISILRNNILNKIINGISVLKFTIFNTRLMLKICSTASKLVTRIVTNNKFINNKA